MLTINNAKYVLKFTKYLYGYLHTFKKSFNTLNKLKKK
jgi:hypothetical protein